MDVLDIGDAVYVGNGTPTDALSGITLEGNTTPFSVFGTYMLQPDTWEVAVRYQDLDNDANEDKIDISVNNYLDGHYLKWTLQYTTTSSDVDANEVDAFFLQLNVAI